MPRPIFEMSYLRPKDTGIKSNYVIYISVAQASHHARVKIQALGRTGKNQPSISLTVDPNPEIIVSSNNKDLRISSEDLAEIKYWVSINNTKLLKLWTSIKNQEQIIIDQVIAELDKV